MRGIKDSLKEKLALLRLRQGDTEAFGFIYDTYIERIYRYIYYRVSDTGIVHDIAQDVFLETWEYIVAQNTVDNLQSFLYRVAYHKVVDHYRTKERQAALLEDIVEDLPTPVSLTEAVDLELLKRHIPRLKQEYQDVILLRHVEGLAIKEIAGIMEKDSNNVRVTLHRALQALKQLYESTESKRNESHE